MDSLSQAYNTFWNTHDQGVLGPSIQQSAPPVEDNQPGFFSRLMGNTNPPIKAVDDKHYPNDYDRFFARQFQQMYGDPSALFDQAGAKTQKMSTDEFIDAANSASGLALQAAQTTASTPEERDHIVNNWIAAQKSSVSALGFDPRVTIHTPPGTHQLTVNGLYDPQNDSMWYDANHEDAVVHESFHRGITKLMNTPGLLPQGARNYLDNSGQELLVRAFKEKYFGDIEMGDGQAGNDQVQRGKWLLENNPDTVQTMNDLENAAAKYIAMNHPRGPH